MVRVFDLGRELRGDFLSKGESMLKLNCER